MELRHVTPDDFDAVLGLRVGDDQCDFVYSNAETLAWAYVATEAHPLAIYADDVPVGLCSYGHIPTDGRCWISHLMVDERWQGRGIGRAALEQLLARMNVVSDGAAIAVTVDPANAAAIRLYEAVGFEDTGRRQNDEAVMLRPPPSHRQLRPRPRDERWISWDGGGPPTGRVTRYRGSMSRGQLLVLSVVCCAFGGLYLAVDDGGLKTMAFVLNAVLAILLAVLTFQDLRARRPQWTWQAALVGLSYIAAPLVGLALYAAASNTPKPDKADKPAAPAAWPSS